MSEFSPSTKAITRIVKLRASGRPLVLFLGAGISASSGFPTTLRLAGYLAQLKFALDNNLLRMCKPHRTEDTSVTYPTPEQLSFDLWKQYQINPEKLRNTVSKLWEPLSHKSRIDFTSAELLRIIEQGRFLIELRDRYDRDVAEFAAKQVLDSTAAVNDTLVRSRRQFGVEWAWALDSIVQGNADQIDELFRLLEGNREPTQSHTFLAFMVRALQIPLVLSTNFDRLLEVAMEREGLHPTVFDIFRDADMPSPQLVKNRLSLVKLHGSRYGLRVGERLQASLDRPTKDRILEYFPANAVVIVLGYSGWERRTMEVLRQFAMSSKKEKQTPKIIWLHQEPNSARAEELRKACEEFYDPNGNKQHRTNAVEIYRILDANTFIPELVLNAVNLFPASKFGYSVSFPIQVSPPPAVLDNSDCTPVNDSGNRQQLIFQFEATSSSEQDAPRIHVFAMADGFSETRTASHNKLAATFESVESTPNFSEATLAMAGWASSRAPDYTCLWIDIADHHSVEGVIAELFTQMQRYDPDLPGILLPFQSESPDEATDLDLSKAVERLSDGFARRRYVICFEQFESFGQSYSTHHGTPCSRFRNNKDILNVCSQTSRRFRRLTRFLLGLFRIDPWCHKGRICGAIACDVEFAMSIVPPRPRYFAGENGEEPILEASWAACFSVYQRLRVESQICDRVIFDAVKKWLPLSQGSNRSVPSLKLGHQFIKEISGKRNSAWMFDTTTDCIHAITPETPLKQEQFKTQALCIAVLSMFRRVRSSVAIHRVLKSLFSDSRKDIDKLVASFVKSTVLWHLEGDQFWMPSNIQEPIYKLISNNASIPARRPVTLFASESIAEDEHHDVIALKTAVSVEYWHRTIARCYYQEVFRPSSDIPAFWEYVYHRVSALRYNRLAEVHLRQIRRSQPGCLCKSEISDLSAMLTDSFGHALKGVEHRNLTLDELYTQVIERRRQDVRILRNSFEREWERLMATVPSETLYGWLAQLSVVDCARNRSSITESESREGTTSPIKQRLEAISKDFLNELDRFQNDLREKAASAAFFNRDYKECLSGIWKIWKTALPNYTPEEGNERPDLAITSCIRHFVDTREVTWTNVVNAVAKQVPKDVLSKWLPPHPDLPPLSRFDIAWAGKVAFISRTLTNAGTCLSYLERENGAQMCLTLSRGLINAAMDAQVMEAQAIEKDVDVKTRRAIESILIRESIRCDRLDLMLNLLDYPPWRANECRDRIIDVQHIENVAAKAADAVRIFLGSDPAVYALYTSEFRMLRARAQMVNGDYAGAIRLLDEASPGLLVHLIRHRSQLGMIDLCRAEVLTLMATPTELLKSREFRGSRNPRASVILRRSSDLLSQAQTALDQAQRQLGGGRRDVVVYLYVLIGQVQICVERLLQFTFRSSVANSSRRSQQSLNRPVKPMVAERRASEIYSLVNVALAYVRQSLDAIPFRATENCSTSLNDYPERKTLALWLQIRCLWNVAAEYYPSLSAVNWRNLCEDHRLERLEEVMIIQYHHEIQSDSPRINGGSIDEGWTFLMKRLNDAVSDDRIASLLKARRSDYDVVRD